MRAALDDAALLQDHDAVAVLDRGQAVRNHERRAPLHQGVHAALHQRFGARVDGGGRFVQNQRGRVGNRGAGNRQQLPLPLREVCAVARQHRIVAVGQLADELVRIGELCGFNARRVRCVQAAVADVVQHRAGEQVRVLQHHAEAAAQIRLANLVDVDVVVADFAVLNVVEAVNQVRDGGFARARAADEGNLLSRHGVHGDVVQHRLFGRVAEINVIKRYAAGQLAIADAAVRRVRMLPCPQPGALGRLGNRAVGRFLRVHQLHIAIVGFRRFIQQVEHALSARQRHDDGVELLGNLRNRLGEAAVQRQKRHQTSRGHQRAARCDGQRRTHHRADNIGDVSQVVVDRAKGVRPAVRFVG